MYSGDVSIVNYVLQRHSLNLFIGLCDCLINLINKVLLNRWKNAQWFHHLLVEGSVTLKIKATNHKVWAARKAIRESLAAVSRRRCYIIIHQSSRSPAAPLQLLRNTFNHSIITHFIIIHSRHCRVKNNDTFLSREYLKVRDTNPNKLSNR